VRSSRPGAPGHAPLVDFCNQNDLQARPTDLETRCAWRPLGFHRAPRPQHRSAFRRGRAGFPTRFHRSGAEESRVRGRLNRDTVLSNGLTGLLRRDGSLRRLRPNPIGSNTSCRATRVDYDRSTVIELPDAPANASNEFESSPPGTRLREGFRGGPPPAPLREKEMRSAAPEVPSITRPPLRGVPFSTGCTQPVDGRTRAFSIFAPDRARTVRRGRRGLDLSSEGGFPLFEEDPPRRAR